MLNTVPERLLVPIKKTLATMALAPVLSIPTGLEFSPAQAAPATTSPQAAQTRAAQNKLVSKGVRDFDFPNKLKPSKPAEVAMLRQLKKSYDAALAKDPNNLANLKERARCCIKLQDWKQASADCEHILKIAPHDHDGAQYCYMLVIAYNGEMDEDNALKFFGLTISAYPNEARLYCERGQLLHGVGKNKEGIADCTRAIALDPNYGEAYFARGEIKAAMGDMAEAISDFEAAVPHMVLPCVSFLREAECQEAIKDWKGAIRSYSNMIAGRGVTFSDKLKAYVHRAAIEAKLGDTGAALDDLNVVVNTPTQKRFVLERNSQVTELAAALHDRATLYESMKKYDLAIKDYSRLIAVELEWNEPSPQWYKERARLLRKVGKNDLAAQDEAMAKKHSKE